MQRLAVLRNIQAFQLLLKGHPERHKRADQLEQHVGDTARPDQDGGDAVELDQDLLRVYAEAFELDANPKEFSLNAILTHERGHQLVVRHPRIMALLAGRINDDAEEIVASVLGAIICGNRRDVRVLADRCGGALFCQPRLSDTA